MGKNFEDKPAAPKPGISKLLSNTAAGSGQEAKQQPSIISQEPPKPTVELAGVDLDAWVLKSYMMKQGHIEAINNLVHLKKTQGHSWIGQKEVLFEIMQAGLATFGEIPERPEIVKQQEKERGNKRRK